MDTNIQFYHVTLGGRTVRHLANQLTELNHLEVKFNYRN